MKYFFVAIVCFFLAACKQTNEVVEPVSVSITNLLALPQGAGHYQMWVRYFIFNKVSGENSPQHEGDYMSAGEFNVGEDGILRSPDGSTARFSLPPGNDPQLLADVCISVQQSEGLAKVSHSEPGSILIGGNFYGDASNAIADLNMGFEEALKANFSSASGKCTIVAPTSPTDSNSGVWFVEPGSPVTAGLKNLPALPTRWRYEGWVVQSPVVVPPLPQVTYYSTGKFGRADSADYDGAGPNKGTSGPGYNFPGQDFVTGAFRLNLTSLGVTFMVTIEPFPDNSSSPFFLHLLTTSQQSAGRTQTLQNIISASAPTARVVIRR